MSTCKKNSAILLIQSPDRRGLVASVTEFLFANEGNIIDLDQHVDKQRQTFYMRVEWDLDAFTIPRERIGEAFAGAVADRFAMQWKLHFSDARPRMAIFVSKLPHCLYDILSRCQSGEWQVEVPLIISNHPDLEPVAKSFGMDYHTLPVTKENKREQERRQFALLDEHKVDFIVLARYMQILSPEFTERYPGRIINIHHAFLPAFPGARPYHSAYERGVKVIGATSHYVTPELDAGPIIEQDVVHVTHKDDVEELVRKGRDLEKIVLSRAVWYHLQRKILISGNRTILFV
ncbi:MAG: formyltetrahydrofolate deformylase [Thermodesulfobacteriota bacterium]